jgi:hypothetical protein
MVEEWCSFDPHEKQHNDRLNITTKGLEWYGSCRILSVVYQLPEPKLAVLESVACTVTRTAMVEECSFA